MFRFSVQIIFLILICTNAYAQQTSEPNNSTDMILKRFIVTSSSMSDLEKDKLLGNFEAISQESKNKLLKQFRSEIKIKNNKYNYETRPIKPGQQSANHIRIAENTNEKCYRLRKITTSGKVQNVKSCGLNAKDARNKSVQSGERVIDIKMLNPPKSPQSNNVKPSTSSIAKNRPASIREVIELLNKQGAEFNFDVKAAEQLYLDFINPDRRLTVAEKSAGFLQFGKSITNLPIGEQVKKITERGRSSGWCIRDIENCDLMMENWHHQMLAGNAIAALDNASLEEKKRLIPAGLLISAMYKADKRNHAHILYGPTSQMVDAAISDNRSTHLNFSGRSSTEMYLSMDKSERAAFGIGALVVLGTLGYEAVKALCRDYDCTASTDQYNNDTTSASSNPATNSSRQNTSPVTASTAGKFSWSEHIPYRSGQKVVARGNCANGRKFNVEHYPNNGPSSRFYIVSTAGASKDEVARKFCN